MRACGCGVVGGGGGAGGQESREQSGRPTTRSRQCVKCPGRSLQGGACRQPAPRSARGTAVSPHGKPPRRPPPWGRACSAATTASPQQAAMGPAAATSCCCRGAPVCASMAAPSSRPAVAQQPRVASATRTCTRTGGEPMGEGRVERVEGEAAALTRQRMPGHAGTRQAPPKQDRLASPCA